VEASFARPAVIERSSAPADGRVCQYEHLLIVLVAMLVVASRNAERRHVGDFLSRTSLLEKESLHQAASLHRDACVSETLPRLRTPRGDKWEVELVPTMPVGTRSTASAIFIVGSTESQSAERGNPTPSRKLPCDHF